MRLIGILMATSLHVLAGTLVQADDLLPATTPINVVIDHYVNSKLAKENIQPAMSASQANLVRRVTLDLAGRIPTAVEAQDFVASPIPQKWTLLVDRLLAAPDFALHHRNELDAMLVARKSNDGKWREYLYTAAQENRPWNVMFREMLLADEHDQPQPSATFVKVRARELDDLTNDISRIFFGVNISCAKCHDHPLVDDWHQDHYFGFASFFNRTYLTKKNTLAEKYSGNIKFKTTAGEEKPAQFMFLNGTVVEEPQREKTKEELKAEDEEVKRQMSDDKAPAPKTPEFSPRSEFVNIALQPGNDRFFTRNIINRIWARLLGRGLVHPLDQMHSANPASHPQLLDWLERDLKSHDFDLKRLVRGIVLSDAYARSSRWTGDGEIPDDSFFARAIPRPLSPRQYSLSLLIASSNPDDLAKRQVSATWQKDRMNYENTANGLAAKFELPAENFQVGVEEALLLSNSNEIAQNHLRDSGDRLVGFLKQLDNRQALLTAAYWSILSRRPEVEELAAFDQYLAEHQADRVAGIQQVVWALLTSPEVRFNY